MFLGKLKSRWIRPYTIVIAYLFGTIKIRVEDEEFVVNGVRLKKYYPSIPVHVFRKSKEDILVSDPPQTEDRECES